MKAWYTYKAYNLLFSSELKFPELAEASGEPDVLVTLGTVPKTLAHPIGIGAHFQATPQEFLLRLDKVAGFLVTGGNRIIVELWCEVNDPDVRLFLLGTAFGALLHQRGALILHGFSTAIHEQGVLFTGPPEIGKSDLAKAFCRKGYPILTEEVSMIHIGDGGTPCITQGFPNLRIGQDIESTPGFNVQTISHIIKNQEKKRICAEAQFKNPEVRLDRVYVLGTHENQTIEIRPIRNLNKLGTLMNNTYRYRLLKGQGIRPQHFKQCVLVANQVSFFNILRPMGTFSTDRLIAAVEEQISI